MVDLLVNEFATNPIGWVSNILIVLGLWGIGNKTRSALWFTMVGEVGYMVHTYLVRDYAITAACTIFFVMAVRAYVKWGRE